MKPFKLFTVLALILAAFQLATLNASAFSKKLPQEPVVTQPTPAPTVAPKPVEPAPTSPVSNEAGEKAKAAIVQIASQSACSSYSFKDRGTGPKSYFEGVALVYARSICKPDSVVASTVNGPASKDVLTHYGLLASNKNAYAVLLGLGMRESSGGVNCGRDAAASNVEAETAEAGTWQTSWNVTYCSTCKDKKKQELVAIWDAYQKDQRKCLKAEFERTAKCKTAQYEKQWGDKNSTGYAFQAKAKSCPAFAAEFAVNTIRTTRSHYGPLNTKAAEYKSQCVDMLTKVEEVVKNNPKVCDVL